MTVAAAPEVLSHQGAVGTDHRSFAQFRKAPIRPAAVIPTTVVYGAATTEVGSSDWTNSAGFRTAAYYDEFASATVEGRVAVLGFDTVDFKETNGADVDTTRTVDALNFELTFLARWAADIAKPGEIAVRGIIALDGLHKLEGLWRLDPAVFMMPDDGGRLPAAPPHTALPDTNPHVRTLGTRFGWHSSLYPYVRDMFIAKLGQPFTIADLEGLGSDLRLIVSSWIGQEAFSPEWHAGRLRMKAWAHVAGRPHPTQTATRWRIGTGVVGGTGLLDAATLVYDSGKIEDTGDYHTVGPGDRGILTTGSGIPANTLCYVDCEVWNEDDVSSGVTTPGSFTTLTAGEAALIHDAGPTHYAADYYPAIPVPVAQWTQTTGHVNVWQATLDRSAQPHPNWTIVDIEEDGTDGGYTEADEFSGDILGELQANPARWWYDETSELAESAGTPTVYISLSTGLYPGSMKGAQVLLKVLWPWATRYLNWNSRNYEHRIIGLPNIARSLQDVLKGATKAQAGNIVVSNNDRLLESMVAVPVRVGLDALRTLVDDVITLDAATSFPIAELQTYGWILDGRPIEIRAVGDRGGALTPHDEAPVLFEGSAFWPKGDIVKDKRFTLELVPRSVLADDKELGTKTFDKVLYPHIRDKDGEGEQPIGEVYGVDPGGYIPAAVIDVGPNLGTGQSTMLRASVSSDGVFEVRLGHDYSVPSSWTTYSNPHITFVTTAPDGTDVQAWVDENIDGEWFMLPRGEDALTDARYEQVGGVTRKMLGKLGVPDSMIVTTLFDSYDKQVHVYVDGPQSILAVLHNLMRSGGFILAQRHDNKFVPVETSPRALDSGIVIRDYAVIGKPSFKLRKDTLGSSMVVNYPAPGWRPADAKRRRVYRTFRVEVEHKLDKEIEAEVYTSDDFDFYMQRHGSTLEQPVLEIVIEVGVQYLYARPGVTVALNLSRALGENGAIDWGLCQVQDQKFLKGGKSHLTLWLIRQLPAEARP